MNGNKKLVIVAPDSFKGTLSAERVCNAVCDGILSADENIKTVRIPVADGGEGTVAALCGDRKIDVRVSGPFGEPADAFYGIIEKSGTAVIEMAACAGLPLAEGRLDPMAATTYGVGELIAAAIKSGARKISLGLGGSCTNDAGCGMAAALGVRFTDCDGNEFIPAGGTLCRIEHIDISGLLPELSECVIDVMCDIDNPLYGERGAAYVFAPQKGADSETVKKLDEGLRHVAQIIKKDLGTDVSELPGGGAAGGCGAGAVAFLGGRMRRGIDAVLDAADFDGYLGTDSSEKADLVITGEGHFDSQSICGKVADGIAERTFAAGVPLIVLAGGEAEVREAYEKGITAVFSVQHEPMPLEEAKKLTYDNIRRTAENIIRVFLHDRG